MSTQSIEKMNLLVADMNVLFVKLHNFHWNVKGFEFHSIHAMTESLYDDVAEIYDALAERVLQLGGKPVITLSSALKLARIKECDKTDFTAKEVLEYIETDYKFLREEFASLSRLADGDKMTEAYADDQVGKIEKQLWMIRATLNK